MRPTPRRVHCCRPSACAAAVLLVCTGPLAAQGAGASFPGSGPLPAANASHAARTVAPFDPSGYWVAVITQDWRFRMVVPGAGEYAGIPLNLAAKQLADRFDATREGAGGRQCEAYGAGELMRLPEHLHIHWSDANTLEVQTDAGQQTRRLRFEPSSDPSALAPSLQGYSRAEWQLHEEHGQFGAPAAAAGSAPRYGSLKVFTDHLLPGLLRKNGVPYGRQASMLEYWEMHTGPAAAQWLIIATEFHDPQYLRDAYLFNPIFLKQPDASAWHPSPCSLRGP